MTFITEDGWNISEYEYKGFKYQIKSRSMKGMKLHVFNPGLVGDWKDAVLFTDRYNFIKPQQLHDIAHKVIARIIALVNMDKSMHKCDIEFTVDGKKVSFSIVHNLPGYKYLSINDALTSWIYRTKDYTGPEFCKYINEKDTEYMAVTLNHYLRVGFKVPKNYSDNK